MTFLWALKMSNMVLFAPKFWARTLFLLLTRPSPWFLKRNDTKVLFGIVTIKVMLLCLESSLHLRLRPHGLHLPRLLPMCLLLVLIVIAQLMTTTTATNARIGFPTCGRGCSRQGGRGRGGSSSGRGSAAPGVSLPAAHAATSPQSVYLGSNSSAAAPSSFTSDQSSSVS